MQKNYRHARTANMRYRKWWRLLVLNEAILSFSLCSVEKTQLAFAEPPIKVRPNSAAVPNQILRTGIDLKTSTVSPNTKNLAQILQLMPVLDSIQRERAKSLSNGMYVLDGAQMTNANLTSSIINAMQAIQQASLDVDFVEAEINAESSLYGEILAAYTSERDRKAFQGNASSIATNTALWSLCEALSVTTGPHSNHALAAGISGILAGVIPSVGAAYSLLQTNLKKERSEANPNMLAKLFDYNTTPETDYPRTVWAFLNDRPVGELTSRRQQLIDRWIEDRNISYFDDASSKRELDVITASVEQPHGLSIASLSVRLSMLQQLSAEILKMKRMLCELSMVVRGEKFIDCTDSQLAGKGNGSN